MKDKKKEIKCVKTKKSFVRKKMFEVKKKKKSDLVLKIEIKERDKQEA